MPEKPLNGHSFEFWDERLPFFLFHVHNLSVMALFPTIAHYGKLAARGLSACPGVALADKAESPQQSPANPITPTNT
ncbi:MAG: hypothetical protein LBF40_08725 [Deltaproteobacteria bacterium]|nr:hypothetical protein [Deltaproteobacteria bacterium]